MTAKASPCHFCHGAWQVCRIVHSDDSVATGREGNLEKRADYMAMKFKVKDAMTWRSKPHTLWVLDRSIKWAQRRIE